MGLNAARVVMRLDSSGYALAKAPEISLPPALTTSFVRFPQVQSHTSQSTPAADIAGINAGIKLLQIKLAKSPVAQYGDGFAAKSLAPATFISEQQAYFGTPVKPLDRAQLDVADMAAFTFQANGEPRIRGIITMGLPIGPKAFKGLRQKTSF